MKKSTHLVPIIPILSILVSLAVPLQADGAGARSSETNSTITHVVVYPNHVQITREIEVDAHQGDGTVTFTGLVPILSSDNLRATASDGVRITGTETRTVYLRESLSEEIKQLDAQIVSLGDALAALERAAHRWAEEKGFYMSIKNRVSTELGKELAANKISIDDWQSMLAFVRKGLAECDREMSDIELKTRNLKRDLEAIKGKRSRYTQRRPREMKEVTVTFSTSRKGKKKIRIHYITPNAGWSPAYDVHLDRKAGTVQIVGYGQITQTTGESWKDVALTLAMSRPDFELSLPELMPMVASFDDAEMKQLANDVSMLNGVPARQAKEWSKQRFKGRQERVNFLRNLEQLSLESESRLQQFGLNQKLIQQALTRMVDRFAGVRYEVSRPETLPCDSSPHKVVVVSRTIPVDLKYVAPPALGDTVMLKGLVRNTTGHPILEGPISLFIDNSYVGASKVASAAQNEGLSFCFGPDDALVVKRELVKRTVKGPEKFRQSQVITYSYRITVENFNSRPASVEVADQIPLTKTPDIQVRFLETNLEKDLDEPTGKLSWTIDVAPGKKSEITYSFSIECPVGRTVYWK